MSQCRVPKGFEAGDPAGKAARRGAGSAGQRLTQCNRSYLDQPTPRTKARHTTAIDPGSVVPDFADLADFADCRS